MDFIVGLPESEGKNAICTIIDRFTKECHHVGCTATEESTSTEVAVDIMLREVYKHHGLLESIISDRGPQFISTMWKSLCRRLGIEVLLSLAWHPETDGQTERANQDVERHLRTFCSYMQDDWMRWLPIAKFNDNNSESAATKVTPFFANKGFHLRISIGPKGTEYTTARERWQVARAENISNQMADILRFTREQAQDFQERTVNRVNEGRKVYLSSKNIRTMRPCKKLDDKQLGPYRIVNKVGHAYQLELPVTMRVHPIFSPNLLRRKAEDPPRGQI